MNIKPSQAREFYRDLCGKYNGDVNNTGQGIASVEHIAETMEISVERAMQFCFAMVYYGITEKTNDGYVI